jgi:hypothetical protein
MKRCIQLGSALFFLGLAAVSPQLLGVQPAAASPREQAARDLFHLTFTSKMADAGAEVVVAMFRQQPGMAPYEDVIRTWYRRVVTPENLESAVTKLYANSFTEDELRQLAAFYRSPLGQKSLTKMPEIMRQASEIGARLAQEHQGELQSMLEEAKRKRQGKGKSG